MIRKLGVMLSAVCLVSTGVMTQAWCCLAVIAAAMLAHLAHKPYAHQMVYHLETASLTTCFATLYLGILLELHKGTGIAVLCSFAILALQIGFVLFFLYTLAISLNDFANRKQSDSHEKSTEKVREAIQAEIDDVLRLMHLQTALAPKQVNSLTDQIGG